MAGFLTDYLNNKILDQVFGGSSFSPPSILYVGLSTGASNKAGTISEPSGGGYNRVAITSSLTNFPAAASGTKSNNAAISFPAPTASWGTIQSVLIADAATGGNVIAMADLTQPKPINSGGSAPTIAVGSLYISHT